MTSSDTNSFLDFQDSIVKIKNTDFSSFKIQNGLLRVAGANSSLLIDNSTFSHNSGPLLIMLESGFTVNNTIFRLNSFSSTDKFIECEHISALYGFFNSHFYQNEGGILVNLKDIENRHIVGLNEPDYTGKGIPSNFNEVYFQGNFINQLIHS